MTSEKETIAKKPKFYILDIAKYNEDFLQDIILWQHERIEYLELQEMKNPKNETKVKFNITPIITQFSHEIDAYAFHLKNDIPQPTPLRDLEMAIQKEIDKLLEDYVLVRVTNK